MYQSHNPSYIRFLCTAERDADPRSDAIIANAVGENESTQVESQIRHFPLEKGKTVMPSGRLPSTRSFLIRMEVASTRPDHLPTLSAAKTSKLSLLVKHHILAIDEAS